MQRLLQVAAFAAILALGSAASDESAADSTADVAVNRQDSAKLFSAFQLVRFPNDACVGTNSRNGTCYTSEECTTKGGTSGGSCASGFGVCCTFSVTCGGTSKENVTYWDSSSTITAGSCAVSICKANDNICQLRLDFTNFVITGPSTVATSYAKEVNGAFASTAGIPVSTATTCMTDLFTITTEGGKEVPDVCGTLSGEHMYVAASDTCNVLNFHLGDTARGVTAIASRSWKIRVTQYECTYENLAPEGCTQYFFGTTSGSIKSFNFDGSVHLANQIQTICIRQEKGICRMCYAHGAAAMEFSISGAAAATPVVAIEAPCGYGPDGLSAAGYECVIIPGLAKVTADNTIVPSMVGGSLGLVDETGAALATVCTRRVPFTVEFRSDAFEAVPEVGGLIGFKLAYLGQANSC